MIKYKERIQHISKNKQKIETNVGLRFGKYVEKRKEILIWQRLLSMDVRLPQQRIRSC